MFHGVRYPERVPIFLSWPVTETTCPNFEIVSVAAKERMLLTVSAADLPAGLVGPVTHSRLAGNRLTLSVGHEDGGTREVILPNVPELDVARLKTYQASLCALVSEGIAWAFTIPRPSSPVLVGAKPR